MKSACILLSFILILGWFSPLAASQKEEIEYLLAFGKKVLIEGTHRGERKWDKACRLKRKSNYLAIVQSDGSSYRIAPAPLGQIIEKICPADVFRDALAWYDDLHKHR